MKRGAKITGQKTDCKPIVREHANLHSSAVEQLEHIRVSERDRQIAMEYLRNGELMGDLISRASGNLRSAGAFVSKFFARAKYKMKAAGGGRFPVDHLPR